MGVAIYIISESKSFTGTEIDGKSLSKASDRLEALAKYLGVTPLDAFYSSSPDDTYNLIGVPEEFYDEEAGTYDRAAAEQWRVEEWDGRGDYVPVPDEEWFEPEAGLITVRRLLEHLQIDSHDIPDIEWVIKDLQDCERFLEAVQESGTRWHLAVDF